MTETMNNTSVMKPLEALSFPLDKNALIEASAGTGKTYTISNLYLRLLLGHQCQARVVSQILILTFTNAATAELKDRILARIRAAWRDFAIGQSNDAFIQALIDATENKDQAQQRLLIASQEMDLASIFTIHGFCQRVLTEHAFESGSPWQENLSLDDSALLKKASSDYWRVRVTSLPEGTLRWLLKQWPTPDALSRFLRPTLSRDIGSEEPQVLKQQWMQLQQNYDSAVEEIRCWWRDAGMSDVLLEADLKANVKIAKPAFLSMMAEFGQGTRFSPDLGKEGWLLLAPDNIAKARKKSSAELELSDFERFEQLAVLEKKLESSRQQYFFWDALLFFRRHLQTQKQQNAELSPDDLLSRLYYALTNKADTAVNTDAGGPLTQLLREKYPVALVDEFQDTDETQFAIFRHLYVQEEATGALIMIGDPKQAIYSFRGGDIHTYLSARRIVAQDSRYTLATNWRSQPALVSAVNAFFANSQSGFNHQDMPFIAVSAGQGEKGLSLNNDEAESLAVSVLPDAVDKKGQPAAHKWGSASQAMAQVCGNQVANYLGQMRIAEQGLKASDICVLVRDRFEAELIQDALKQRNIDSVFLRKDSVLKSPVAYSIWLLLRAIAEFKSESNIKAALLDALFAYSHEELSAINSDLSQWQQCLQYFANAHDIWSRQGVMAALEYIAQRFELLSRIMARQQAHHRCITDLRHLSEILQFQSTRIEGKTPLINWFEACLAQPDLLASEGIEGTQWRLDTDQNLVQISTIHASKGLQYPVVMLPFCSRFKDSATGFYHDEQKGLQYRLEDDEQLLLQQQQERLSEDIRLFYVALTRAEFHCWLGAWNNAISPRSAASGFAQTAIGSVLDFSTDTPVTSEAILLRLQQRLSGENVTISELSAEDTEQVILFDGVTSASLSLDFSPLSQGIHQDWLLTSYSAISRTRFVQHDNAQDKASELQEQLKAADETSLTVLADINVEPDIYIRQEQEPTQLPEMRFAFTRGASAGSYLHEVLENCAFDEPESVQHFCLEYADKYSVDPDEVPKISDWLVDTLQSPLTASPDGVRLWDVPASHRLAEMEFYLPLNQVDVSAFNQLLSSWLPDMNGHYQLQQLNGMLKGYLDLIYIHQGRFYVADYKSNHLGDSLEDYGQDHLDEAMSHHDYYLQALLYSVALHRYLKNKLAGYDPEQHLGGAQYLFLRGMSAAAPGNGVLTVSPPIDLIYKLDTLFSGKQEAAA